MKKPVRKNYNSQKEGTGLNPLGQRKRRSTQAGNESEEEIMKKSPAKKSPQTQVKKDGTRIRFGTTPGGRAYSSSKTKEGRQQTTVTESGPGKTLKVWDKFTDKKNPSRNFKERNVLGSDKYIDVKKGPTKKA